MKKIVFFCVFIIIFFSCKKEYSTTKITSDILVETVENSNGKKYIKAETEKIYGNSTNEIDYSFHKTGNTIIIKFKKILNTGILTVLGPAETTIELTDLNKDEYNLKFKLSGTITKGKLTVTPLSIELDDGGNVKLK
jgi:hypothetical protein